MSGRLVGGRYRLQQRLGRGGMASVWRAQDVRLDRAAAVKVLDPASRADPVALERLRREAHSVSQLAHQNLVNVYDFRVDSDVAYLAMELVEGHSLTDLLAVHGRLPVRQAADIASQVCDALAAAHAAGVAHRDIKPANILIDPTGTVKVCDFGIAFLYKTVGQAALTGAGNVVGTSLFMAPEQAVGDPVDARSDLYAVGCVLYAMLTGAPPFNADNPIDVLHLHLEEPPVPLRAHRDDIPPDLDWLIGQLLAKNPADRPATAWWVRDRLRAIAAAESATAAGDETWRNQPTAVHPAAAASAQPPDPAGRHRAPIASRLIPWVRQWVPLWVAMLVTGALVTTLGAVLVLAGGEGAPAPSGRPPQPVTEPEPNTDGAAPGEPTPSTEPAPSGSPSPTVTGTPPRSAAPLNQVIGLAGAIRQQADAGQLASKAARELLRKVEEVARLLAAGDTDKAGERFAEVRARLAELRRDGRLTEAGFNALPDLDDIARSIDAGPR